MGSHDYTDDRLRGPRQGTSLELRILRKLENLGWHILGHDIKILHTQIDILARDAEGELAIIEVKSARIFEFGGISKRQKQRLKQVALHLAEKERCQLLIAVEDHLSEGGVFLTAILD